jgi:D-glycero-alpha-D-manno-heptose-7-phosphate kinase
VRRRLEKEPEVTALFEGIAATAAELAPALVAGDLPRVGELMSREWNDRRRLADGISTPVLEELLRSASAAGAWGGKACGAGGGGCLAILGPPERRDAITAALESAGGKVLNASPTGLALQITR